MNSRKTQTGQPATTPEESNPTEGAPADSVEAAFAEETTALPESSSHVDQLTQELADAEQRTVRLQADLENYRKRARRDMDEQRRYALLPFLQDLLPAIDNLQRALDAMSTDDTQEMQAGIQMVAQQLLQVLAQHDCHPIEAEGKNFDPTWHEAIAQEPTSGHPPGTILRVQQTGYRLHDRVVRPAYVVVAGESP